MSAQRALVVGLVVAAVVAACRDEGQPPLDGGPDTADAGDASPPADAEQGQASYRAVALFTALDRIVILKSDPEADLCAVLRLVSPSGAGDFGITTPENWGIDVAGVTEGAAACEGADLTAPAVAAAGGTGEVTFAIPAGMFYPESLSVDATIAIDTAGAPAWVPQSVVFRAEDLAVEQ